MHSAVVVLAAVVVSASSSAAAPAAVGDGVDEEGARLCHLSLMSLSFRCCKSQIWFSSAARPLLLLEGRCGPLGYSFASSDCHFC